MTKAHTWNKLDWAGSIVDVLLQGGNETGMEFIARQLPLNTYVRSNLVDLDEGWEMDDASLIPLILGKTDVHQQDFEEILNTFLEDTENGRVIS